MTACDNFQEVSEFQTASMRPYRIINRLENVLSPCSMPSDMTKKLVVFEVADLVYVRLATLGLARIHKSKPLFRCAESAHTIHIL